MKKIAMRYRREREDSDEVNYIPLMELAKRFSPESNRRRKKNHIQDQDPSAADLVNNSMGEENFGVAVRE